MRNVLEHEHEIPVTNSASTPASLLHSLPRPRTLLTLLLALIGAGWELSRSASLPQAIGHLYVGISVVVFTLAWVIALVAGVVQLMKWVEGGMQREKEEMLKAEQERIFGGTGR